MDPSWSEDDNHSHHSSNHTSQQQYKPRQYATNHIPDQPGRESKINSAPASSGMRRDRIRAKLQQEAAIRALKPALKRSSRTAEYSSTRQMSVPPPRSKDYSSRQMSVPPPHFDEYSTRQISPSLQQTSPTRQRSLTRELRHRRSPSYSPDRQISPPRRAVASRQALPLGNRYGETPTHQDRRPTTSYYTPREDTSRYSTPQGSLAAKYFTSREIPGYPTPRTSGYQRQQSQARILDHGRTSSLLSNRTTQSARSHTSYKFYSSTLPPSPGPTPAYERRGRDRSSLAARPGTSRNTRNFDVELEAAYNRKTTLSKSRGRSTTRSLSPELIPAFERRDHNHSPLAVRPRTSRNTINFDAELLAAYRRKANLSRSRGRSSTRPLSPEISPAFANRNRHLSPVPSALRSGILKHTTNFEAELRTAFNRKGNLSRSRASLSTPLFSSEPSPSAFETHNRDHSPPASAPRPKTSRKISTLDSTPKPTYDIHTNLHKPRGRSPIRRTSNQIPHPATIPRKALSKGEHQGNSRDISEQNDTSPTTTIAAKAVNAQLKTSELSRDSSDTLFEELNSQQHQTLSLLQKPSVEESPAQVLDRDGDSEIHSSRDPSPEPVQPILKSVPLKHRYIPQQLPPSKIIKSNTTFTPAPRKRRFDTIATPSASRSKSKPKATPKAKTSARTPASRKRVKFTKESVITAPPQLPSIPPEQQRQLTAAAAIISRETASKDIQLFGEVIETDVEREKRVAAEQLALETARKAKEAKEKKAAEKAEAKAIREREKLRITTEKAEIQKLKKETAEIKKKIQRERARKKDEVNRQRELELKRQIALQKIENDRVVAKMEGLLRERAQREKEDRMKGVQVEADAVEKMKKNQERMKRQAAGLSAARTTDPPKEDETSMFLPDSRLPQIHPGSMTSAATLANTTQVSTMKSYNAVKESIERKKELERQDNIRKREAEKLKAKGEQLKARATRVAEHVAKVKKTKAMQAQLPDTPPKTPKTSKAPKTPKMPKPKPKPAEKRKNTAFAPEESDADDADDDVEMGNSMDGIAAASMLLTPESNKKNRSAKHNEVSSGNNESASSPCPPSRSAATKPKTPRTVDSVKAAAAKQKRDHAAREKERVRLVEEAENGATTLTNGELDRKLNSFMAIREMRSKQRAKTNENKAARERAYGGAPTSIANAVPQLPLDAPPTRHEDEVDLDMVAKQASGEAADQARRHAAEKAKRDEQDERDSGPPSPFAYMTSAPSPRPLDPLFVEAQARREARRQRSISRGSPYSKLAEKPFVFEILTDSEDSESSDDEDYIRPAKPAAPVVAKDDDAMEISLDHLLNQALDAELGIFPSESKTLDAELAVSLSENNTLEVFYPPKVYALRQQCEYTRDDNIDPTTGEKKIGIFIDMVSNFQYSDLSTATSAACEYTLALVKPHPGVPFESQELYKNHVVPLMKETRDIYIKEQTLWNVMVDLKNDKLWWAFQFGDTIKLTLVEFRKNAQDEYDEVEVIVPLEQAPDASTSELEDEEVEMDEPLNESYETRSSTTSEHELEDVDMSASEQEGYFAGGHYSPSDDSSED